jgi:hypothetical protein
MRPLRIKYNVLLLGFQYPYIFITENEKTIDYHTKEKIKTTQMLWPRKPFKCLNDTFAGGSHEGRV